MVFNLWRGLQLLVLLARAILLLIDALAAAVCTCSRRPLQCQNIILVCRREEVPAKPSDSDFESGEERTGERQGEGRRRRVANGDAQASAASHIEDPAYYTWGCISTRRVRGWLQFENDRRRGPGNVWPSLIRRLPIHIGIWGSTLLLMLLCRTVPLWEPSWVLGMGYSAEFWLNGYSCSPLYTTPSAADQARNPYILLTEDTQGLPPHVLFAVYSHDAMMLNGTKDGLTGVGLPAFDTTLSIAATVALNKLGNCSCDGLYQPSDFHVPDRFTRMERLMVQLVRQMASPCRLHMLACPHYIPEHELLEILSSPSNGIRYDSASTTAVALHTSVLDLLSRLHVTTPQAAADIPWPTHCIQWQKHIDAGQHSSTLVLGATCGITNVRFGGRGGNSLLEMFVAAHIDTQRRVLDGPLPPPSHIRDAVLVLDHPYVVIPEEEIRGFGPHSSSLVSNTCPTNIELTRRGVSLKGSKQSQGTHMHVPGSYFTPDVSAFLNDEYDTGLEAVAHVDVLAPRLHMHSNEQHYRYIDLRQYVTSSISIFYKWYFERADIVGAAIAHSQRSQLHGMDGAGIKISSLSMDPSAWWVPVKLSVITSLQHAWIPTHVSNAHTALLGEYLDALKAAAEIGNTLSREDVISLVNATVQNTFTREEKRGEASRQYAALCNALGQHADVRAAMATIQGMQQPPQRDGKVEELLRTPLHVLHSFPSSPLLSTVKLVRLREGPRLVSLLDCTVVVHVRLGDVAMDVWRNDVLRQEGGEESVADAYKKRRFPVLPKCSMAGPSAITPSFIQLGQAQVPLNDMASLSAHFDVAHPLPAPAWTTPYANGPSDKLEQTQYLLDLLEVQCSRDFHQPIPLSVYSHVLSGIPVWKMETIAKLGTIQLQPVPERPWLHVHLVVEPSSTDHPLVHALVGLVGASVQASEPSVDFATLLIASQVFMSTSTFSWLAGSLSRAAFVHYPHHAFFSLFADKGNCMLMPPDTAAALQQHWVYHDVLRALALYSKMARVSPSGPSEADVMKSLPCEDAASVMNYVAQRSSTQPAIRTAAWLHQGYDDLHAFYYKGACMQQVESEVWHVAVRPKPQAFWDAHTELIRDAQSKPITHSTLLCTDTYLPWLPR
jgi:hypothetical protein